MRIRNILSALTIPFLAACGASPNDPGAAQGVSEDLGAPDTVATTNFGHGAPRVEQSRDVRDVLLLSIDGLLEQDLENFIAAHPDSALAGLARHGVRYTNAWVNRLDGSATNPSDSFPGLLALITGGSSKTTGGWYDVSYTRDLYPSSANCTGAPGTAVAYDESIEKDNAYLWGDAPPDDTPTHQSSVARSRDDLNQLPYRKSGSSCTPVFPHQYMRVNTIFQVAKEFGLHTAWSDKHLAYDFVNGTNGEGVDDFFGPEINSDPSNSLIPSAPAGSAFTDKWTYTEVYDDFKVQAILNEIDGKWSDDGLAGATDTSGPRPGTPALFGMNFQALSVAQKSSASDGGYLDAAADPAPQVADALSHTDASIGKMVAELEARHLYDQTLVVVTAKHGQSPIDKTLYTPVDGDGVVDLLNGAGATVAGHIEDDVALYWLADPTTASTAAAALLSPTASPDPRADQVFTMADPKFVAMFGDPTKDPHTPDVVVKVVKGTIYSLSKKKDAEHGGFADDDAHVGLLLSNPGFHAATNDTVVRTKQVAPTILSALHLPPWALDAVRAERTETLPNVRF